jgi:hypothetical protein
MDIRDRNIFLIRTAFILLVILVAVYIPLKLYIVLTEEEKNKTYLLGKTLSIFATSELKGEWKPCG